MDTIIVLTALYILLIGILYAPKCPKTATSPAPDLDKAEDKLMLTLMSIRDLKKLASQAKIKNYSSLTKSQLIAALA
jgi:hypothetical protein